MIDDRHRGLKRWERARQFAGLEADPDLVSPLAECKVRTRTPLQPNSETGWETLRVHIVRIFTRDLVCVHIQGEIAPEGLPGPCWLVRGGIEWGAYMREIVRHYARGLAVPEPFRPRRKLSPEIIAKMQALTETELPLVFAKLRETGLIPTLPILDRTNCPTGLTWETLRANFQDFLEKDGSKNTPPP